MMKIKEAVETLYSYGVEYEDINEATDTLLTAYEKEKEKNKEYEILLKRQEELQQEKENLTKQGWLNE